MNGTRGFRSRELLFLLVQNACHLNAGAVVARAGRSRHLPCAKDRSRSEAKSRNITSGLPSDQKISFPTRLIRCKIASHPDVHMRKLLAIGTIAFVAFTMSNVPVLRAQALAE